MRNILLAALLSCALSAQADVITLDFEGSFHGFNFSSGECSAGPNGPGSPKGWHAHSGFIWGPCPHEIREVMMTVTRDDGRPFTLLGFDSPDWQYVRSSRGGFVITQPDFIGETEDNWIFDYTETLRGPEWRNVEWITFCVYCDAEADSHDIGLIDNVRFWMPVSEPTTLGLFALPIAGLLLARCHRARTKNNPPRA